MTGAVESFQSRASGVGHKIEALAPMRRSDLRRRKYSRRNATPHPLQSWDEGVELSADVPDDVLAEQTSSPAFGKDAQDMLREEPLVVGSGAQSDDAVRLAWVARKDAIHKAAPWSSVEGGKVRPDRSLIQVARFHTSDKVRGCERLPLNVSDAATSGFGNAETESETADPGATFKKAEGTKSHN